MDESSQTQLEWNQLKLELKLLSVKEPGNLLHLFLQINYFIDSDIDVDQILRKINFLGYELNSICGTLDELERFKYLNDFYFSQKQFQAQWDDVSNDRSWLVAPTINDRRGSQLLISLIYLHISAYIDLPVFLINAPSYSILKWVRSEGHCSYIDLTQQGKVLSQKQVLEKLKSWKQNSKKDMEDDHFDILPPKEILEGYLGQLIQIYKKKENFNALRTVLDIALNSNNSQMDHLRERALLYKKTGESKKALADMSRFFSFVKIEYAPEDIREAYYSLVSEESSENSDIFH